MTKKTKARKHSSSIINELLNEVTPLEMEQTKVKMQLAAKIEDMLTIKGWSKSKLAELVGKNPSEITKWLSGTQNFTVDILTEIAYAFDINIYELLKPNSEQVIFRKRLVVKSSKGNQQINVSAQYVYPSDLSGGSVLTFQENQIAYSSYYTVSK